MKVLAWLVVPLCVTAIAVLWAGWHARTRRPRHPAQTAAAYSRFQAALERPHPDRARTVVHQPPTPGRAVGVRRSPEGSPPGSDRPWPIVDPQR